MKILKISLVIFFLMCLNVCTQEDNSADLTGPYFGQILPGNTPEIFAPGIISKNDSQEFACTFSPDGKEFFFTRRPTKENFQGQRIWYTKEIDGQWTEPSLAPFTYDCFELEPFISPDGMRLYYGTTRPLPGSTTTSEMPSIWVAPKTETGWGTPEYFAPLMMYVSETNNKDLYYTDLAMGGYIAVKKWNGSSYDSAEKLSSNINYVNSPAHPHIAPDGSYLLYDGEANNGYRDLYVSFKNEDNTWARGIYLEGGINTTNDEMCPSISPDGEYLFFESDRSGNMEIYWVNMDVIESLR